MFMCLVVLQQCVLLPRINVYNTLWNFTDVTNFIYSCTVMKHIYSVQQLSL